VGRTGDEVNRVCDMCGQDGKDEVNRVCDMCGQEDTSFGTKMLRKYQLLGRCRTLQWTLNNSMRICVNLSGRGQGPGWVLVNRIMNYHLPEIVGNLFD
jgi:hypothetical protein